MVRWLASLVVVSLVVVCGEAVAQAPLESSVEGSSEEPNDARSEPAAPWPSREQVVRVAGAPAFPGRAELWARRVTRALEREGAPVSAPSVIDWDREGLDERALVELEEIEAALAVARRAQVALEETEAMRALAAASHRARELLHVPGAASWLAEVEVVTAIVAAQRGEASLAEASLRRALALAPDRALQEGEAAPELVARSVALMREEVRRARLEVRVEGSAAEPHAQSQVFVDDRPIGPLPRVLDLPAGLHVIRVEARGHRAYARLVDLAPGSRAPMIVALAPSAASRDADALEHAIETGHADEVAHTLARIVEHGGVPRDVWLLYVGTGALDRAVVVRCGPGACGAPRRIDDTAVLRLEPREPVHAALHDAELARARVWIDEPPLAAPAEPSVIEQWWLWAGVGAVVVGVGVGVGLALSPSGEAPLVLRIDPCTSCGR